MKEKHIFDCMACGMPAMFIKHKNTHKARLGSNSRSLHNKESKKTLLTSS
jgi:hypothetical protein